MPVLKKNVHIWWESWTDILRKLEHISKVAGQNLLAFPRRPLTLVAVWIVYYSYGVTKSGAENNAL